MFNALQPPVNLAAPPPAPRNEQDLGAADSSALFASKIYAA
jgi:hypothetical protein